MIKENVSREEILAVLEGIEKHPEMYGRSADAIEGIYFALLCLLASSDKIREIYRPIAYLATGLHNCIISEILIIPKELVRELKKIRVILLNENS